MIRTGKYGYQRITTIRVERSEHSQKRRFRHFTDDGIRGTTFKRPGLDAMLDEIRAGNVATVIIKDQSRIGRDVVEAGLLKRTFDEYHVRFIAANDNLDTANGFDITSIFRDVINEWYVADTSRKIKTFSSQEWKRACVALVVSAMATVLPKRKKASG